MIETSENNFKEPVNFTWEGMYFLGQITGAWHAFHYLGIITSKRHDNSLCLPHKACWFHVFCRRKQKESNSIYFLTQGQTIERQYHALVRKCQTCVNVAHDIFDIHYNITFTSVGSYCSTRWEYNDDRELSCSCLTRI